MKCSDQLPFISTGFRRAGTISHSQYSAWRREYAQNRISFRINATSRDFSRRTNKRVPYPRSDGSVSMGFMTRIKVGTRNRRKDRINTAEEGDSITQEPSKYAIVEEAGFRMDCFSEDDFYLKKNVTDEGVDEIVEGTPIGIPESAYGGIGGVGDKVVELLEKEGATENEMGINSIAKDTRELRKKETTFTKENGKSGSFSMKDVDGNEIGVSSGVTESKESPKKETASAIGIPELAYDGMSGVSGKVVELLEKEGATENEMGINSIAKDTRELRKKETTFTKENGKSGSFSMKHVDDNEIGVSSGVKESKELPKKEIASAIGIPELAYNGIGGVGGKVVELLEKEGATENEMGINSIVKDTRELRKKGTTFAKENGKFGGFSMKDVDGNEIGVSSGVKESKELPKKETASAKENGNFGSFSTKNVDGNEIGVGSVVKDSKECPKKETASAKENGSFDDFKKKLKEKVAIRLQKEREANLQRQEIEQLAEQNLFRGNKLFVWPQVVKAGQDIEVFLNRSLSTLNNEPDVFIMGAFNDWRLKSFRVRLNKTHLNGDWWSLQINVPKEAYKMDFVFFNGRNVYDNNETKDFCIPVEGKMDAIGFDNFLLEEKRRELEELALEQAERKRQEKEKRRIEAEKAATEADKAQAKMEAEKRRETLQQLRKNAVRSIDNVWHIEPREFNCGDSVRLYYNRSSGPLAHATELWIHGGHNKWKDGLNITEILVSSERKDGDWWYANVIVPDQAIVLDWVFANGPPQEATLYDNNNLQDFHALVTEKNPGESYWVEEEQHIFQKLQEERKIREEYILTKAERTSQMRAEKKERTLKSYLLSQKNIVYTEPLDVQAGSTVTVFYNHTNTVLNGKPEVWLRCSFNRWTHRMGPLQPKKMFPTNDGSLLKARVNVPLDTYMMDFVFSESGEGGAFDNNNGMDYHLPVFGGVAKQPPMHIVHIALEMAPIAKVGGLGDVVTSLSRAVQEYNHNVNIVLPKYDCMNLSHVEDLQFHKSYDWGGIEIKVWQGKVEGLSVYFLDPQNGFFRRGCIYGCNDDAERFGFFCHAALEFLLQSGMRPDIIHCHDWSSAPVAWLYKEQYKQYGLNSARVVFTIHNLEFGQDFIGKALTYSDKATTVSPTYSKEVSGSPVISPHLYKFHGILNGIDPDIWDPYNDKFIPVCYTPENVVEGKRAAKEALQQRLGLKKSDLPLVGIITRLTHQKGIHLIKHAIRRTLERGGQVVLLGSAPDPRIQNDFVNLSNDLHSAYGDRARLCLTYDEPLSHLIYAGSDFMLVPSIFEPCGLTQLTAMRYGSVPVVRKTGGLYDTVFDVDNDKERAAAQGLEPNGFSFDGADEGGVDYALNRAISAWYDGKGWFNSLCKKVMEQDWSWNRPALDYLELYHAAHKN